MTWAVIQDIGDITSSCPAKRRKIWFYIGYRGYYLGRYPAKRGIILRIRKGPPRYDRHRKRESPRANDYPREKTTTAKKSNTEKKIC
jgi:hypothetical protein